MAEGTKRGGKPPEASEDDAAKGAADEQAEREKAAAAEREEAEPRYTIEALKEGARTHFNCSPHIVAGALSTDSRETLTLAQAQTLVEKFIELEHTALAEATA